MEAIIHGAGVVDLFFKEAESVILGQKPAPTLFTEEPKALFKRIVTLDVGLGNVSATGEFFKVVILTTNAYDKTKETVSSVATGVVNLFSQKLNGGLSAALESFGLTNSENNTDSNPATSEVFPSQGLSAEEEGSSSTTEVSSLSSSSQDKPASSSSSADKSPDKFKLAEESLQDLQKQALVLQIAQTSRFNLDGVPAVEETSMSRRNLDIDVGQPKFATTIIPGFGGGGTGGCRKFIFSQLARRRGGFVQLACLILFVRGGLLKRIIVFQLARRRGGFLPHHHLLPPTPPRRPFLP